MWDLVVSCLTTWLYKRQGNDWRVCSNDKPQAVARVLLLCADVRTIPLAEKLMSLKALNYSLYICLCIFIFCLSVYCTFYLYCLFVCSPILEEIKYLILSYLFAYAKTKTQVSCAVTAHLISTFVFVTRIVQSLYFLNPKLQTSRYLLWL